MIPRSAIETTMLTLCLQLMRTLDALPASEKKDELTRLIDSSVQTLALMRVEPDHGNWDALRQALRQEMQAISDCIDDKETGSPFRLT